MFAFSTTQLLMAELGLEPTDQDSENACFNIFPPTWCPALKTPSFTEDTSAAPWSACLLSNLISYWHGSPLFPTPVFSLSLTYTHSPMSLFSVQRALLLLLSMSASSL